MSDVRSSNPAGSVRRIFTYSVVSGLLALFSGSLWAFTVTVEDSLRRIEANDSVGASFVQESNISGDFAAMFVPSPEFADARIISSSIPPSESTDSYRVAGNLFAAFSAVGSIYGWSLASLEVNFSIDEALRYTFAGEADHAGALTSERLTLVGSSGEICSLSSCFSNAGILQPGQYALSAAVGALAGEPDVGDNGVAGIEFEFKLTAVPIPPLLFLFAPLSLCLCRRRRQR